MFEGLKQLFGAKSEDTEEEEGFIEENQFSFWNEHTRIVLAIVVVICGALFMWWIVA